jgi:hypothetical protein
MTLMLGAQKKANGAITAYAKGVVHHCEIWDEALGNEECIKLAMWPKETSEFTIVSFGAHPAVSGMTKIDFVAAQLTWPRIKAFLQNRPESFSFHDTYMKEWLNQRFYKALPAD